MEETPASDTALSKAVWLDRFATRLQELRPHLTSIAISREAVACHRYDFALRPEAIAERVAKERFD
jgi:hypothetical protein